MNMEKQLGTILVKNIYKYCQKNNISRNKFAKEMNIQPNTMGNWKTNNSLPDIKTLLKIASKMECSLESLFDINNITDETFENTKESVENIPSGIILGNILDKYCTQNNLTQTDLAKQINISQSTIASWKTRNSLPSIETLYKISRKTNLSIDFLVTGNNQYFYFTKNNVNYICSVLKYLSLTPPSERFSPFINIYSCKEAYELFSDILINCSFAENIVLGNLKYNISNINKKHFNFLLNNYNSLCDFLVKKHDNIHSYESNYYNSYFAEIYQRININY